MEFKIGFHHKYGLALIWLFIIFTKNGSANKRMVILVDFSAELINYITEINRTVIIEKGNTLEIHWKIGHGKDGYLLYDLKTFATEDQRKTSFWKQSTNTAEMIPDYRWKHLFGNRLKAIYNHDVYKMIVQNVKYTDSTQHSISGVLIKDGVTARLVKSFVQVQVNGGPEFCEDIVSHMTSESSAIQFTLCGFPTPKVLWSYDTKLHYTRLVANAHKEKAYVNFFSLNAKKKMCGQTLHFIAIGDKDKTLSWKKKLDLASEATEVTAVTQSRTNTSRSIFWSPVEFGKCNIHYVVKLYSGDELLLDDTTKNCFYRFNSKYMNSTSFRIWAIVEKEKGNDLPDIKTDYPYTYRRPNFSESVEGKAVITGCVIICLVLVSLAAVYLFFRSRKGNRKCKTSREESRELVLGDYKNKKQNESGFKQENTTKLGGTEHPYYSEIKHDTANKTLKSKRRIPPKDRNSVTAFADKHLLNENAASYEKLGLINHSPYAGLEPIDTPNKVSSQKHNNQRFSVYAEIKDIGKGDSHQESCINIKDYSENNNSSTHNGTSYIKMEAFCPLSYTQLQTIKSDAVPKNN